MGIERKKIIRTEDSRANATGLGYNINVTTTNTNKTLPTGEVIKVIGAEEQFQKERKESTNYRLTATINSIMYYPQDYHWIGTWNSSYTTMENIDESYETNVFKDWNYLLPNILSPDSIDPTEEDFRIDRIDNWVGHVVYPYENDYLKLYELPSFSVNVDFLPNAADTYLSIDTGITNILYNDILNYLGDYVTIYPGAPATTPMETYFDSPTKPITPPTNDQLSSTLRISNKKINGYTQDGVPFLFTIPVPTENGWQTALYVPFKHNFNEGDYIFIKPIVSNEYGDEYSNCDPTLYGFKRVLGTSWKALSEDSSLNYIIIEHKTEFHWDWTTIGQGENTAGEDYPWTVTSSQGFVKRVVNYSDGSTIPITTELLNNGHFSPAISDPANQITVTLLTPHNLKLNDFTLISVSEDALGTNLPNEKKPTLFNLSGIYTVLEVVDDYSFNIRAKSQQDLIAFFNGTYTLNQLVISPTNYYIECSKLISVPSEYYLRKGKIINSINNFDVSDLPMSNSIFMDKNYNAVIDEDINTKGLEDNWGFPVTQLYLLLTKRAGQIPFDFTDVETFFSWKFNFQTLLTKTGEGLDTVSKRSDDDQYSGYVKNSAGGYMDEFDEYLGDWYYIDFSEFNNNLLLEQKVTTLSNRFNGAQRECGGDGECNYEVYGNDFDGIYYNAWSVYNGYNTSNLSISQVGGRAKLESTTSWTSPTATANSGGNFIRATFLVTNDTLNSTLVLKVKYEQQSSTGMIRIFDPGGNQIQLGNGGFGRAVGNASNLAPPATTSNDYTVSFIPTTIGSYTIALGLMNYSAGIPTGGNYIGYFDDLQVIKYFGTPQYAGWVYDPLTEYTLQVWSSYIETADPNVLGIPYWARYIDGLYFWRDLLSVGYFEDVDQTIGVDYPFLNGSHYVNQDKNLMVSLSPFRLNDSGTSQIIFGCQDDNATNYNILATYPCGNIIDQQGPCVEDGLGNMQTDTPGVGNYNEYGCCCQYDGSGSVNNVLTEGDKFASRTKKLQTSYNPSSGPSPPYDIGDQMIGWNVCRGIYPFWKDATYWGNNFASYNSSDSYPTVTLPTLTKLAGVMVGEDNPTFNVPIINGNATYDVFRYENYTTDPNFNYLYGELGDGAGSPLFSVDTGRYQNLFDLGQGSYGIIDVSPSGNWTTSNNNGLSTWGNTIPDTNGFNIAPKYFSHSLFEFFKFDTTQCKTCYDQGDGTISTGDYLAPRHGWPVDVDNDGNPTSLDINGKGIPGFQTLPLPGNTDARSGGSGSNYEGYAGIVTNTDIGSETVNIAAHRVPSDPNNWRMFYGTCVSTWACLVEADKGIWPSGSSYPACADPACTTEADCVDPNQCGSTWGPLPTQTWTTNELVGNCSETTNCQRHCSCVNPAGGSLHNNYYSTNSAIIGGPILPLEQPTQFIPNVPPNMVNNYEFRGRVNIEMGINYDGYEKYFNSGSLDQGWALAGPGTGGPPITYNNPYMSLGFSCLDNTCITQADCIGSGAGQCNSTWSAVLPSTSSPNIGQNLANSMSVTNAYMNYTRLYSGFWIGVVSSKCGSGGPGSGTERCTYIYDPDDGTEGGGANATIYQSDGWGSSFTNTKWQHGCGGWKKDGITEAVNKMAYSPCRNNSNGYADCNVGDTSAINYDVINYLSSEYLPSCGENGMNSSKSDFQKNWSQSFKSDSIPMHEGDKAFIFIRSVGGTLRTNNTQINGYGTQNVTINGSSVQVENYLPTYWAARLINSAVA